MRRTPLCFCASLLFFLCLSVLAPSSLIASSVPAEGEVFPDLTFSLPQKVEERQYLGVEEGPFRLSQVGAEVLIIEIFSMYCPHCQKEAPNMNTLFHAISARPELKSRVKLIGIGAGNTAYEVSAFRNLYRIEFPLLPDADMAIHKRLGEVRTPYFFVLWKKPEGRRVVYSQLGAIGDPYAFLDMVAAKTGAGRGK